MRLIFWIFLGISLIALMIAVSFLRRPPAIREEEEE
jgi:hypothetical protein